MELFNPSAHYGFMSRGRYFFAVSILLVLGSLALWATKGMTLGIDFAGGAVVQVKYEGAAPIGQIRDRIAQHPAFEKAAVTKFGGEDEVLIRTPASTSSLGLDIGDVASSLLQGTGSFEVRRVDMVGPKVGDELREKGILAVVLASLAIMAYVALRYEWRFAIAAIIALAHDISITIGAIVLLDIDVNLDVVAALLTILGYSINDTIIVFDRIRETIRENRQTDLREIIDESVSRTLSRTTLTSLTVFFVVLTLYLFGGEIITGFSLPLLVGVVVGTYSSIFIAAQMVIYFGFSVQEYRRKEAEALKRKLEKERMRQMYEKGVV